MDSYYIDAFNEEDKKRLAKMLILSRNEGGVSQEKVALELGVAKKTVQNWERGLSAPNLVQAIGWFRVMKVTALPYLIQFLFPDMENISQKDSDDALRQNLISLIETLPAEGVRQLMFLLYGEHGSSPRAVLNLMTAYLQSPLKDRYISASMISNSYNLAMEMNKISCPSHIRPDAALIDKALVKSREAVKNSKCSYMLND